MRGTCLSEVRLNTKLGKMQDLVKKIRGLMAKTWGVEMVHVLGRIGLKKICEKGGKK